MCCYFNARARSSTSTTLGQRRRLHRCKATGCLGQHNLLLLLSCACSAELARLRSAAGSMPAKLRLQQRRLCSAALRRRQHARQNAAAAAVRLTLVLRQVQVFPAHLLQHASAAQPRRVLRRRARAAGGGRRLVEGGQAHGHSSSRRQRHEVGGRWTSAQPQQQQPAIRLTHDCSTNGIETLPLD